MIADDDDLSRRHPLREAPGLNTELAIDAGRRKLTPACRCGNAVRWPGARQCGPCAVTGFERQLAQQQLRRVALRAARAQARATAAGVNGNADANANANADADADASVAALSRGLAGLMAGWRRPGFIAPTQHQPKE